MSLWFSPCPDLSLGISVQVGCPSISFPLSESPSVPHLCLALFVSFLYFLPSFPLSLSLSAFSWLLPLFVSLLLPISPSSVAFPVSLCVCVSGFRSDSPFARLYFYPSDTPPVSISLSVCLSPSLFSSGPSSWSQLVGCRQGSGRAPTPSSSLQLAAPNEPGGRLTPRP